MKPMELIQQLIREGGAIVSSNDCTEMEIVDARVHGRAEAVVELAVERADPLDADEREVGDVGARRAGDA